MGRNMQIHFFFNSKALETGQVRSGQRAEKGWRMSHWGEKRKKHFPAFFVVSAINLTHLHVEESCIMCERYLNDSLRSLMGIKQKWVAVMGLNRN